MRTLRVFFVFLIVFGFSACSGGSSDTGETTTSLTESSEVIERVSLSLAEDVSLDEAIDLLTSDDGMNPGFDATLAWDDHTSYWTVPAGTPEFQREYLLNKETEEVGFLIEKFDETDPDQALVIASMQAKLDQIDEFEDLPIVAIELDESDANARLEDHDAVDEYEKQSYNLNLGELAGLEEDEVESVDHEEDEDYDYEQFIPDDMIAMAEAFEDSDAQALMIHPKYCKDRKMNPCDPINDAKYVPLKGSSTVWKSGSLQKFWIDPTAARWFDINGGGVEIKTIIAPKSFATCGKAWNTNMAYKAVKPGKDVTGKHLGKYAYRDTEDHDWATNRTHRVCGVGHLKAKNLMTSGNLRRKDKEKRDFYWTWHSFKGFKAWANPQITIQWTPTSKNNLCTWKYAKKKCKKDRGWCKCDRRTDKYGGKLGAEYLIQYRYKDFAGKEVHWKRQLKPSSW